MFYYASDESVMMTYQSAVDANNDRMLCCISLFATITNRHIDWNNVFSAGIVVNSTLAQIVASPYNWHSSVVAVAMAGDGSFSASYNARDQWTTDQRVSLINEKDNTTPNMPDIGLSAIAMDHDGSLYDIRNDTPQIVRYA